MQNIIHDKTFKNLQNKLKLAQPIDPEFVKKDEDRRMEDWLNSTLIECKVRELAGSLSRGTEKPLNLYKLDRRELN